MVSITRTAQLAKHPVHDSVTNCHPNLDPASPSLRRRGHREVNRHVGLDLTWRDTTRYQVHRTNKWLNASVPDWRHTEAP
jgi:hypothetical protein